MSDQPDKFRSIRAFQDFEQRSFDVGQRSVSLGEEGPEAGAAAPSPLRVLAALKRHPDGVLRLDLARELGVAAPMLDDPLLHLFKEDLVHVEAGPRPDEDLVRPA